MKIVRTGSFKKDYKIEIHKGYYLLRRIGPHDTLKKP